MNAKLVVSLIVACLVVIFILQNTTVVNVQFLFWSLSMSRSLLIIVFVGVGMLVGWLLNSYVSYRHRHK
jgi:putative membrane protein